MRRWLWIGTLIACGGSAEAPSEAPPAAEPAPDAPAEEVALTIREIPVPWPSTRPRDPYVAPDGAVWFVGQSGDYLARFDPTSASLERHALPEGSGPHTVIVDAAGVPWYAGNRDRHIGRVDPVSGEVQRFEMPEGVDDPHTMAWTSDGRIWFTAQRSAPAGYIGRFDPKTGATEVVAVPGQDMRPYGLVVGADDRPWIAFMGSNAIGSVDPETLALTLHETPDPGSRIRRLGLTSDGRVWWADAAKSYLGVYDPRDGSMRQWQSPGGPGSALYATAVDDRDRVWTVESGRAPNRIVAFDTRKEAFVSINAIPSGGGSVRHMVFDPERRRLWFGTDTNNLGWAEVP